MPATGSPASTASGGMGDGALRADVQAGRGEQLGDVGGQQQIGGDHLAEPEVDEPHLTTVVEEDVRQPEVAMGEPVPPQLTDEAPDRGEHVIGHLARIDPVERLAVDRLVGEDVSVRLGRRPRRAGPAS